MPSFNWQQYKYKEECELFRNTRMANANGYPYPSSPHATLCTVTQKAHKSPHVISLTDCGAMDKTLITSQSCGKEIVSLCLQNVPQRASAQSAGYDFTNNTELSKGSLSSTILASLLT